MNKPTDLKVYFLVLRAQLGNDQAFHQLYHRFASGTMRFLQSLVKSDEAQDLNQELWLTVYKRIASLSDANRFKTWLFQVARNKALDYFRQSKRLAEFHEILKEDTEESFNPEKDDIAFENKQTLELALMSVPIKQREAIVLNYLEGMDYDEISMIVGCSLGTVKSRIHNAKLKIKELIELKNKEL